MSRVRFYLDAVGLGEVSIAELLLLHLSLQPRELVHPHLSRGVERWCGVKRERKREREAGISGEEEGESVRVRQKARLGCQQKNRFASRNKRRR